MLKKETLKGSALVLAAIATCYSAKAQTNVPAPAAAPPAASAGLLNDYLRKHSDAFKPWDFGGQVRARYEMKDDFATPGQAGAIDFRENGGNPHNHYVLLREKVHVGYSQPWFGVYVEGRDSSESGDDRDPNPEADEFDLQQGYFKFGNPKEFPLSLQVGRQELIYGDERLIGNADWLNIPRTFDAVKLRYEGRHGWIDAFTSRPVLADDHSFNLPNEYETFSGHYASTKTLIPKQESQAYFLARNVETESPFAHARDVPQSGGASARDIYTVGIRFKSLPNQLHGWDYGTEIMGQFGRYKEGATTLAAARARKSLTHEAFAAYVGGGYTWTNVSVTPRLGAEYNFATGDNDPNDDKHGTFDNLYPTNHKFYGIMDFVSLQNIHNVRFMASVAPVKKLTLALDYHLFWLADTEDSFYTVTGARRTGGVPGSGKGYGLNPGYGSFVGSEIDLVATYKITPWAIAQGGYGHFFTGRYINQSLSDPTFGSTDADYVYLQMTLNF
jgi:hypothetical protein